MSGYKVGDYLKETYEEKEGKGGGEEARTSGLKTLRAEGTL